MADDHPGIAWEYGQEKSGPGRYFVRVEIRRLVRVTGEEI
jgi:hypothetical protein